MGTVTVRFIFPKWAENMTEANKIHRSIVIGSILTRISQLEVLLNHRNILPRDMVKQSFYLDAAAETYKYISFKKTIPDIFEIYLHGTKRLINVNLTKCRIANFMIRDSILEG